MTAPTDRLGELRRLAERATPGPYVVIRFDKAGGAIDYQVETEITQKAIDDDEHVILAHFGEFGNPKRNKRDAEYYAAASPAVILGLLDQLDAARGALEKVAQALLDATPPIQPEFQKGSKAERLMQGVIEAHGYIVPALARLEEGV